MTETSSTQNRGLESGSLIVGRIRPPLAMWAALEGITGTTQVKHGMLIIFSQNTRGRIGVFCNRYISGAVMESTGAVGLDAVRELLSIQGGMFGFRACMADEWTEVGQSLGLDIEELLASRTSDEAADVALRNLMVPGSQLVRGSDAAMLDDDTVSLGDNSLGASEAARVQSMETSMPPTQVNGEGNFSYLDWLSDPKQKQDEGSKFKQVLLTALPKVDEGNGAGPDGSPSQPGVLVTPESHEQQYGRLLQSQQEKVIRDIELSMQRGRTETENVDDAVSDLQLLSEFIQAEQDRAKGWTGLDAIPTPKGGPSQAGARISADALKTSQRMRAVSSTFEATGNDARDIDRLVNQTSTRIIPGKDFVKGADSGYAPPNALGVGVSWWQRPITIGIVAVVAITSLAMVISQNQADASFDDTLKAASESMRENPAAAAKVLTAAIDDHGGSPRAYFYRGIAYGGAGEYEKSIADLDEAAAKGEDKKLVLLAKGAAGVLSAKYTDAIAACDAVLKTDPKNVHAQNLKVLALDLRKRAEPPSVMFVQKHEPVERRRRPSGRLNTAVISDAVQQEPEVAKPKDPKKMVELGYKYLQSGRKSEAMELFVDAIKADPNEVDARRYLAHLLAARGNSGAAIEQFNALVSLNALRSTDVMDFAQALADHGSESRAIEVLSHFVQQTPNDMAMRTELLRLYVNTGAKDKADALYQESLPLAGNDDIRHALQEAHGGDSGETIHIRRR